MSTHAARARAGRDRPSLYQEITDKITAELEAGRVPWVQTWGTVATKASLTMPKNAATQRQYSGINVLILWDAVIEYGFSTQNWLTFRQALRLGGNVRKGEHGTTVVYADRFVPDEECERAERDGAEPNAIPFLKRFTVFNTDQCERLPAELTTAPAPVPDGLILPHAEALIAATGADFRIGGDRAFYSPAHDFIQVPRPEAYFEPINWHRTALHELGHWTGHANRLGRDLSGHFGSALREGGTGCGDHQCLFVRLTRHRADRAPCRLHWLLARGVARGRSRHRARCQRRFEGGRLSARVSSRHRPCLGSRDGCRPPGCDRHPDSMRRRKHQMEAPTPPLHSHSGEARCSTVSAPLRWRRRESESRAGRSRRVGGRKKGFRPPVAENIDMATAKITLSASRDIPFNKLVLSQSNVRRIKAGISIEELAEDIARRSLLQSLNVRAVLDADGQETGLFEVPAGGRRFRALELLVKQKRMKKTEPVPCVVRTDGLAEEDSLAENVQRAALHPLDQFRAFETLREKGLSEEDIAARFFVSPTVVKQRLKLAAVSQKLLDVYAEDGMTLEQLMAFTVTNDHARQEQVWDALAHSCNKEPYHIRRQLTEDAVRAADKRAPIRRGRSL